MLVSLTVGKIDAGVCVLLTEDKRLIEFPSILLPPDITSGSIVDVNVSRNFDAEQKNAKAFESLQSTILSTFGSDEPSPPALRCRNATQTSVVLEWDPISLATASLRSLGLYRNGAKAGNIPRPMEMTSTKISGLAVDTEYTFNLVLRTSAGTYSSEKLVVRTHKMTDLSGITITPGVMAPQLRDGLERTVERVGAKLIEQVRIDTTHFVCTEEKGPAFQKAKDMNIPIVLPDWIIGCEREGRLVGVRGYYLNADPKLRQVGQSASVRSSASQQSVPQHGKRRGSSPDKVETPTTNVIPPTPEKPQTAPESEEDDDDDSAPSPVVEPAESHELPQRELPGGSGAAVEEHGNGTEPSDEDDRGSPEVAHASPEDKDSEDSGEEGGREDAAAPAGATEKEKFDEVDL